MNKQEELKSAEEIMSYEESRKYLISEGLDPDQITKEGMVFIKTVKENIELKKQLKEYASTMSKYLKIIGLLTDQEQELKSKLKEKEEEIERLKKIVNDDSDYKAMRNYAKELEHKLGINPNSKK